MKYISTALISICASCVFMGALQILCPKGNMEKSVKYIISLVFLIMIISGAGITMDFKEIKLESNINSNIDIEEMDKKTAEFVYSSLLEKNNVNFEEIEVCTDKREDGSIVINKVCIKTKEDKSVIINAFGQAAKNIQVEIVNE